MRLLIISNNNDSSINNNINCSIVRLPTNINNEQNNDSMYREIKYIHSMIFSNNQNNPNNDDHNSLSDNSSESSSPTLDYVKPNNIDREKAVVTPELASSSEILNNNNSSSVEYTMINLPKTVALKESTVNNQQKRDEYFRLTNNGTSVRLNNNNTNSIFQQLE